MTRAKRLLMIFLVLVLTVCPFLAPLPAVANETGKKNTAIGLGVGSLILLFTQKNKLPGVVVGGGAVYAYSQYERERQQRKRSEAWRAGYQQGRRDAYVRR